MIEKVGDAACRDAASFLEACAERIEPHLQSVGTPKRGRRNLEQSWWVEWLVSPKRRPDRRFYAGVWVDEHTQSFVPYIWCRGGRRAEDDIVAVLNRGIKGRTIEANPGVVALARISVGISEVPHNFDIERDAFVAQVCDALTLTAEEMKALAAIAS